MSDRHTMEDESRSPDNGSVEREQHVSTLGSPSASARDEPTTELVGGVLADMRHLVSAEVESAKLEARAELKQATKALLAAAIGGGTLAMGALLVLFMLVYALAEGTAVPLWGSYGIVGGVLVIIGIALLAVGKVKARDADGWPEESVQQAKQDAKWLKDETRSQMS